MPPQAALGPAHQHQSCGVGGLHAAKVCGAPLQAGRGAEGAGPKTGKGLGTPIFLLQLPDSSLAVGPIKCIRFGLLQGILPAPLRIAKAGPECVAPTCR